MFVYDFVQLETPFEVVRARLLAGPAEWAHHDSAAGDGDVTLEFDRAVEKDGTIAMPFHWRTAGDSLLFTSLDGHLEVSRLGPHRTHMSLLGNYQPPQGEYGRRADCMGLHHVAEAGLRTFLRRVADRLVSIPVAS